jgi:hypothetical protein
MPWEPKDATKHNKKASTPEMQRQWADVANSELQKHGNEGLAIRAANSVIKRHPANIHLMKGR